MPTTHERVLAAAERLAPHAYCVDVLITSLSRIVGDPDSEKYRKVNMKNDAFQRAVSSVPGGIDFMYKVGFEPMHGYLVLQRYTPLVATGLQALKDQRSRSAAYATSREALDVQRATQASVTSHQQEVSKAKAKFAAKVPEEPVEGEAGSCALCFHVGGSTPVWRRFESCATLEDVLNFARSLPSTPLPREDASPLGLRNITTRPGQVLDTRHNLGLTLQTLDLWPSGHIEVAVGA